MGLRYLAGSDGPEEWLWNTDSNRLNFSVVSLSYT